MANPVCFSLCSSLALPTAPVWRCPGSSPLESQLHSSTAAHGIPLTGGASFDKSPPGRLALQTLTSETNNINNFSQHSPSGGVSLSSLFAFAACST